MARPLTPFQYATATLNIPFDACRSPRREDRIYLLSHIAGDWILAVPEFFGLAGLATSAVIKSLAESKAHRVFTSKELSRLIVMDEKNIRSYCEDHQLPPTDRRRLMRWARWSQSHDRTALEKFFRSISNHKGGGA